MDEAVRQFHLLCADGVDFEEISRMMEEEIVEVDCIDQFENTALMIAAAGSGYSVATTCCLLLEHGARINATNRFNASALNLALGKGNVDAALLLLRRGANPNNHAKNGNVPLLISAQLGLTDLCLELLRYGANVNIKLNDGANVAFLASQTGNLDLLKLLAASGANLGLLRNDNTNALLIACQLGHSSIVRELLKWHKTHDNTNPDPEIFERCVKKASARGFTSIVKLLTEHTVLK